VRNAADAEDTIQEIFVNLWRSAGLFDSRIGSEANFVATIARRKVIDRLRAQARLPSIESFDENTFQAEAPAACESSRAADLDAATRALDLLAADQRELVLMGIVQGLSHSEIARATGKPLGTVKATIRRGIAKVRAALARKRVTSARFADRAPTRPARAPESSVKRHRAVASNWHSPAKTRADRNNAEDTGAISCPDHHPSCSPQLRC
jgi:RNA polymerase sigma-70 factor (ECF subfamily)